MATTSTRRVIRRQIMDDARELKLPGVSIPGFGIGLYFTATTVTATTLATNDPRFNMSGLTAEALVNHFIYRPALTTIAAGMLRRANTFSVASGVITITHFGPNQSDTSDTVAEIWHPEIDPQEVDRIIESALEYIYTDYTTLLTIPIADHDQATAGTGSWSGSAGTTLSKITAAGNAPAYHYQTQRVQNDSANDYSESASFLLPTNWQGRLCGFVRSAVGTSILRLQGASTSLDSISSDEASFVFLDKDVTVSADQSCTLRLENSSATGDSYWGAVAVQPYRGTVVLPSWVDGNHKLKAVSYARFNDQIASNVYDARSLELEGLSPEFYRYNSTTFGANPHLLELSRQTPGPVFITGSRPHSDIETFSSDTATTTADLHNIVTVSKWLMGRRWPSFFLDWERKYENKVLELARIRETVPPRRVEVRRIFF